jgi:hypothetical protein
VASYLEAIDPTLAIRYLRYVIDERGEKEPDMHDRLVGLWIAEVGRLGKVDKGYLRVTSR